MGFKNSEECKKYMRKYFSTEHGVLKKIFHHMKERSIKNNWDFNLEFDGFKLWAYNNNYKKLYDNWVISNKLKNLKPSVDRINEYGIYEYSNMRIITWIENWEYGQIGEKNINAYNKVFLKQRSSLEYPVLMIGKYYLKKYSCITDILKEYPHFSRTKISAVCLGRNHTHHKYLFCKLDKEVIKT